MNCLAYILRLTSYFIEWIRSWTMADGVLESVYNGEILILKSVASMMIFVCCDARCYLPHQSSKATELPLLALSTTLEPVSSLFSPLQSSVTAAALTIPRPQNPYPNTVNTTLKRACSTKFKAFDSCDLKQSQELAMLLTFRSLQNPLP